MVSTMHRRNFNGSSTRFEPSPCRLCGRPRSSVHLSRAGWQESAGADETIVRKSCVFCGRSDRKISNEHAWPNWVRALFPPGRTTVTSGLVEGTPRRWIAKDDMGVTVNAICKARNEGWLHKLENAVEPILSGPMQSGATVAISAPQQTSVATWAYGPPDNAWPD